MKKILFLLAITSLSACTLEPVATDPQFEYAKANVYKNLELPPDLTIERDSNFSIPGIDELNSAAPDYQNAKLIRGKNASWLEIDGDIELVWSRLHDFLNIQGIKIESSDKLTGLIKSAWLKNQTGIQAGDLIDNLQASFISNNYLDQYVISVERDNHKIKVVIMHNGLTKITYDDEQLNRLTDKWIKTPSNPALTIVLLKKFMAYSGLANKVGTAGFTKTDLANLFKNQIIKKQKRDHFIIVKKQADTVFANLKNNLANFYEIEKVREQSQYIVINEPYLSVRLEKTTNENAADKNFIRIQVLPAGYQTRIVIRNDRGESIDLATTDKLLKKLLTIEL